MTFVTGGGTTQQEGGGDANTNANANEERQTFLSLHCDKPSPCCDDPLPLLFATTKQEDEIIHWSWCPAWSWMLGILLALASLFMLSIIMMVYGRGPLGITFGLTFLSIDFIAFWALANWHYNIRRFYAYSLARAKRLEARALWAEVHETQRFRAKDVFFETCYGVDKRLAVLRDGTLECYGLFTDDLLEGRRRRQRKQHVLVARRSSSTPKGDIHDRNNNNNSFKKNKDVVIIPDIDDDDSDIERPHQAPHVITMDETHDGEVISCVPSNDQHKQQVGMQDNYDDYKDVDDYKVSDGGGKRGDHGEDIEHEESLEQVLGQALTQKEQLLAEEYQKDEKQEELSVQTDKIDNTSNKKKRAHTGTMTGHGGGESETVGATTPATKIMDSSSFDIGLSATMVAACTSCGMVEHVTGLILEED